MATPLTWCCCAWFPNGQFKSGVIWISSLWEELWPPPIHFSHSLRQVSGLPLLLFEFLRASEAKLNYRTGQILGKYTRCPVVAIRARQRFGALWIFHWKHTGAPLISKWFWDSLADKMQIDLTCVIKIRAHHLYEDLIRVTNTAWDASTLTPVLTELAARSFWLIFEEIVREI